MLYREKLASSQKARVNVHRQKDRNRAVPFHLRRKLISQLLELVDHILKWM